MKNKRLILKIRYFISLVVVTVLMITSFMFRFFVSKDSRAATQGEQSQTEDAGAGSGESGGEGTGLDDLNGEGTENVGAGSGESGEAGEGLDDLDEEFTVSLKWNDSENANYVWNSQVKETKTITLNFAYSNTDTPKTYNANKLKVTIPGIGNINRNYCKLATVNADEYTSITKTHDWSYQYDNNTDIYTFYNNNAISEGSNVSGTISLSWELQSRNCKDGFTQNVQAIFEDVDDVSGGKTSSTLNISFTSKKDVYEISRTAKMITSTKEIAKYIEEQATLVGEGYEPPVISDYIWVKYNYKYNAKELYARGLQNRYIEETFPDDCIMTSAYTAKTINAQEKTITYKLFDDSSIKDEEMNIKTIVVGYPQKYIGEKLTLNTDLYGMYNEEVSEAKIATQQKEIEFEQIDTENNVLSLWNGTILKQDENIVPNEIEISNRTTTIDFTEQINSQKDVKPTTAENGIAITADMMEIYTNNFEEIDEENYKYTKVVIPAKNKFYNTIGNQLRSDPYRVIIKVIKKDAKENERQANKELWQDTNIIEKIYDEVWTNSDIEKNLVDTEHNLDNVIAVRVEITGLAESIENFYINIESQVNINNYIENHPKYLYSYDYTDYINAEGNSITSAVSQSEYSRTDLYTKDANSYGKGYSRMFAAIKLNEERQSSITVTIQDSTSNANVSGVKYGIYANENILNSENNQIFAKDALVAQGISDSNGNIVFRYIPVGNYYVKEIETVYGYVLSDAKTLFTVSDQNVGTAQSGTINISRNTAKLELPLKNNLNESLDDAANLEISLYDSNDVLQNNVVTYTGGVINIDNLEWNNYYITITGLPDIYEEDETKYSFNVNRDSFQNGRIIANVINDDQEQLSQITAIVKKGTITINKSITATDLQSGNGKTSFMFKIVAKDAGENSLFTMYRFITFNSSDLQNVQNGVITKLIEIADLEHYKYEITEESNYRYVLDSIIASEENNSSALNNTIGVIDLTGKKIEGEITFVARKAKHSLLSDSKFLSGSGEQSYTLTTVDAEYKNEDYIIGTELNKADFRFKLVYSNNKRVEIESNSIQNLQFNGSDSLVLDTVGENTITLTFTYLNTNYSKQMILNCVQEDEGE